MDHGDSEFWGYEKVLGRYDVIDGVKEKNPFFDLTLHFELILDGYSTYLRTENYLKRPVIWESFDTD